MKMTRAQYDDRSYDFSDIEDDPRLKRAGREMKVTFWAYALYVFITLSATYYTAATLGFNEVFWGGVPAYLCVLMGCALVGCLVMIVLTQFVFTEDSLDDEVHDTVEVGASSSDKQ